MTVRKKTFRVRFPYFSFAIAHIIIVPTPFLADDKRVHLKFLNDLCRPTAATSRITLSTEHCQIIK